MFEWTLKPRPQPGYGHAYAAEHRQYASARGTLKALTLEAGVRAAVRDEATRPVETLLTARADVPMRMRPMIVVTV
jgi:hypothetical protein